MDGVDDKEPASISTPKGLNWKDRPSEIQERIDDAFEDLSCRSQGVWSYNGSQSYGLANVNELRFIQHLIKTNPHQKEFTFLDIGAGDFQWGDSLAKNINELLDIPEDVKINIISTRAEGYEGEEDTTVGKCRVFKLGNFKAENMEKEEEKFKNKYFSLINNVDVIVSQWCFRHLVDPVGTLQQTYSLLKPNTGLFIGDGFFYGFEEDTQEVVIKRSIEKNIMLLLDMKVSFLVHPNKVERGVCSFIFKKPTEVPLQLPLKYKDMAYGKEYKVYAGITRFEHVGPKPEWGGEADLPSYTLCGNSSDLFDFFKDNNLFDPFRGRQVEYKLLKQKG